MTWAQELSQQLYLVPIFLKLGSAQSHFVLGTTQGEVWCDHHGRTYQIPVYHVVSQRYGHFGGPWEISLEDCPVSASKGTSLQQEREAYYPQG